MVQRPKFALFWYKIDDFGQTMNFRKYSIKAGNMWALRSLLMCYTWVWHHLFNYFHRPFCKISLCVMCSKVRISKRPGFYSLFLATFGIFMPFETTLHRSFSIAIIVTGSLSPTSPETWPLCAPKRVQSLNMTMNVYTLILADLCYLNLLCTGASQQQ